MSERFQGPALAVDAVWIDRQSILLVRRAKYPFEGWWALPGGFVELNETVEEAVVRELREETGLTARPLRLVGVYSGPKRDPRKPVTSVVFLVRGRRMTPHGSDDAAEARWIPLSKLPVLAFDHAEIVRDALGGSAPRLGGRLGSQKGTARIKRR